MMALGELLKQSAPESGTEKEQIEYIDIDHLQEDDRNFYVLSDLEGLSANIELIGLQQPIRVRGLSDKPGHYVIVSGHRRRAALRTLVEEGKEKFRQVPCIVERAQCSKAMQELRLIYANSSTREMTSAEKAKEAERVKDLLYQLQEEGVKFPGRMRDHVAEACKISKSKLSRLEVITKKLDSVWKVDFDANKMPEATAYIMARFPKEFQQRIRRAVRNMPDSYSLERLLEAHDRGTRWEPTFQCQGGKPCPRGDTFLRHDLEDRRDHCGGAKCCLECSKALTSCYPCERACSKAKERKKSLNETAKATEEARKAEQQKKYREAFAKSAQRIVKAADAAGLSDDTEINPVYYKVWKMDALRKAAQGEFGDIRLSGNDFAPGAIHNVVGMAKQLQCSADYLLELSDELRPNPNPWPVPDLGTTGSGPMGPLVSNGWMPGETTPSGACDVVAVFDLGSGRMKDVFRWDGKTFCFRGGAKIDMEPKKWMALPPDEDEPYF